MQGIFLFLLLFFAFFEDDVVVIDGDEPWKVELKDKSRKGDEDRVYHRDRKGDCEPDVRWAHVHPNVTKDKQEGCWDAPNVDGDAIPCFQDETANVFVVEWARHLVFMEAGE